MSVQFVGFILDEYNFRPQLRYIWLNLKVILQTENDLPIFLQATKELSFRSVIWICI